MKSDDLISRSALLEKKTRMTEYDETGCGVHVYVVSAEDVETAPAVDAVSLGVYEQVTRERDAETELIGKLIVILKKYPNAATNGCAYEAYREIKKWLLDMRGVQ